MNERTNTTPMQLLVVVALVATAFGCGPADEPSTSERASVDRASYIPGEEGVATFVNTAESAEFLSGCTTFEFQKNVAGRWESRGNPVVCVFEGIAVALEPGEVLEERFMAPSETGEWRLAYQVGSGCDEGAPLSQADCLSISGTETPAFRVEREPCSADTFECRFVPAAPNILCDDGVTVGGPSSECTRDPVSGRCGYEIIECPR